MALALKSQPTPELAPNLLRRALILSILIHLTGFGAWKVAQYYHFFDNDGLASLIRRWQKSAVPVKAKALEQAKAPVQTPIELLFNIDATEASATPPEKAMYYGPKNTLAANPVKANDAPVPQIDGSQNKVIKTTTAKNTQQNPLRPTPAAKPAEDDTEKTAKSQLKMDVGDLAMLKIKDPSKEFLKDSTGAETETKHKRPRTLKEAQPRSHQGEKMAQAGGVVRLSDASLATKGSIVGDYDSQFVEAVRSHWYTLLEDRISSASGNVTLQFVMHADGRVDQLKLIEENVGPVLELICERAILYTPYDPWPPEMRKELRSDEREVRFTFYYE